MNSKPEFFTAFVLSSFFRWSLERKLLHTFILLSAILVSICVCVCVYACLEHCSGCRARSHTHTQFRIRFVHIKCSIRRCAINRAKSIVFSLLFNIVNAAINYVFIIHMDDWDRPRLKCNTSPMRRTISRPNARHAHEIDKSIRAVPMLITFKRRKNVVFALGTHRIRESPS